MPFGMAHVAFALQSSQRFSTVLTPFSSRLLTVIRGFSPFSRFLENGRDDEPHAAGNQSLPFHLGSRSPRRTCDQQESGNRLLTRAAREYFPRQRHLETKVDRRAVEDMPKNCPCEGGRRWVFREFSSLMGMLNLSRGQVTFGIAGINPAARCLPPTACCQLPAACLQ
jgi:hypothetical protein